MAEKSSTFSPSDGPITQTRPKRLNKPPKTASAEEWRRYSAHLETLIGEKNAHNDVIQKLLFGWQRDKRVLLEAADAAQKALEFIAGGGLYGAETSAAELRSFAGIELDGLVKRLAQLNPSANPQELSE